ncbi:MAG: methyltransferase domain-containing protein [Candidatus Levybacteria bacterium]|nr:methyltransferase domain-containing protein [Candidatus Levybacteria bacterium]
MTDQQKLDAILANTGDMCLKRRAGLLIKELNPQKKDKILDVGCGDGYYLYLLSRLGEFDLTGIDEDPQALKNARKQIGSKSIKYIEGNVLKMPFKSQSFNKIVCSEVLEHLPDDKKGLLEMKRVLKKGGTLCITVPNLNYPFFWDPINYVLQRILKIHVKSGFWSGVWNFHLRLYTYDEFKKAVKDAGFKIEKIKPVTHFGLPFNHYLTNIGFRIRTSKKVSKDVRDSMSKFNSDSKKTWFSYVLDIINYLDKRNNKKFAKNISTVGIFLKATKI